MITILHNIRSLYNVGSIFRTADAVAAEKIYLCGITPSPLDPFGHPRTQLTKVSLGAEKTVDWEDSVKSPYATKKLIEQLKKDGYKILALEMTKNAIPYYRFKIQDSRFKIVLILGNEVKGLPEFILKSADKILSIPMVGKKESLNVGVAFAVAAFYLKYKK